MVRRTGLRDCFPPALFDDGPLQPATRSSTSARARAAIACSIVFTADSSVKFFASGYAFRAEPPRHEPGLRPRAPKRRSLGRRRLGLGAGDVRTLKRVAVAPGSVSAPVDHARHRLDAQLVIEV